MLVGGGPVDVIHDQDIVNSETRLVGELGLKPWLAAGFVLPVRVFSTAIRYLDANGRQVAISNPFVHHNNRTITGAGDSWVFARASRWGLGARLGVSLPFGRTEPDPFALGDAGLVHEHSQFGSGTFQPILGIDASRTVRGVRVDAFGLTLQSLYANTHGYQAGDRYAGGMGVSSTLGTRNFRLRFTGEVQHETAERWGGIVRRDEGNIGRTDVLVGAEVTWRIKDWRIGASLKLPVYVNVQGGQLDPSAFAGITIGTQLRVFERKHDHDDHDHEHGHEHPKPGDWTGLDKRDITNNGSAVPLVPVPGKITVFDFWATWCEPCGVIDHELAEIVRRHPNDIAVRKVNVIDTDSAAYQKYLSKFTLPHLKVYGRDGKLLWERSAAPLALTGDVERLVTGKQKSAPVAGARRIPIEAVARGYAPDRIEIRRGEAVTLVFTRTTDKGCSTDVHFTLPDGTRIDEELPLGKPVEIPLKVETPGEIVYSCGMDMNHGTIVVK